MSEIICPVMFGLHFGAQSPIKHFFLKQLRTWSKFKNLMGNHQIFWVGLIRNPTEAGVIVQVRRKKYNFIDRLNTRSPTTQQGE